MDTFLFFLINQGLQNVVFDFIMPLVTKKAYIFFGAVAVPLIFKDWRKTLLVFSLCIVGLAVGDGTANILKHAFERLRPCQSLEGVRLLVGCGGSFSFPSSHAVNAFAIAAIFSHFFRKATLPMFFIAALVAFSRVYVGVHYPSDIIAGALWGGIIAGIIIILKKWSLESCKEKPYTTILFISLLALSLFRYYYIATGPIGLSPDEAHYWEWSRRLDLSYYSKGPVIAYLIAFTTWLMGDTAFAVRFFAPIFLALSSLFIYRLTMEIFPSPTPLPQGEGVKGRVACAAALVFQITPIFATYGVLMTIDSPFIFLWTLSLYLFWKAVNYNALCVMRNESEKVSFNSSLITHHSSLIHWILLGIAIGLGLLTKYTMAFFYVCVFLFIVSSKEHRFWLKKKEPYLAFLISLIAFSPVIIWNAHYDWVTVKHTAGQAHISGQWSVVSSQWTKDFFEFIGSQIGVITPLLFFLVMYGAIRNYASRITHHPAPYGAGHHASRFLFWFWVPVLGFFILKSLQGKVQANWDMPAYITAFIASADFFLGKHTIKKSLKILLSVALIMAFLVTMVSHYPKILNLPVKMDPTSRLRGWKELGIKIEEIYNGMTSAGSREVFIFSDKYQVSSEIAFYMPSKPTTYCINLGRRMNQYDIWGGFEGFLGLDAIFVRIGNENFPEELKNVFDSYEKEKFIVQEKDKTLREYIIFKCYGFKGLPLKSFENY